MTKKIKIAEIIGKWVGGGVEQVVYNYCSRLDKNRFEIDFLIDEDSVFIPRKELEKVGINVKIIPPYQKVIKYQRELTKLCEEEKYDIVHSHLNALSIFPLRAAKKAGIKVRIAHSHSTTNKKEKKKNILKQILKPFSKVYATDYFCCTEHAGRWLFGDKEFNKGNVYVMNNAIDVDKFKFDEHTRQLKRKELGIDENAFVIGHCGRFVEQKNHRFLIDIFNEVHKKRRDAALVLVGQGPLKDEIEERISELGLKDCVKFLGQREDINQLYSIFDLFLFPSLYEGLGMVFVEAQVAGCYCIASTEVPKIAQITNNVEFVNLNENIDIWVQKVMYSMDRYNTENRVVDDVGVYDINKKVGKLEEKYQSMISNAKNVELFGLPACGKSTYANKVLNNRININKKELYNNNRIIRNLKKILNCLQLFFINPRLFIISFKYIKKIKDVKRKIKTLLYILSTANICIKAKRQDDIVIEEGLFQVLWCICYNSDNYNISTIKQFIKDYEKILCKNIIIIDTNLELIKKRLQQRNSNGGSELEHEIKQDESVLKKADIAFRDIIMMINDSFSIKYDKGDFE